jgi:outer membrane biosynthesis protein TonB
MRRAFTLLSCAASFLLSAQRLPAPVPEESPTSTDTPSKSDSVAAKHETGNSPDSSPTITPAGRASITNRGVSSVPTTGTPLGRYKKMVYDGIGSKWYAYVAEKANLIALGTARISFWVDQNGR